MGYVYRDPARAQATQTTAGPATLPATDKAKREFAARVRKAVRQERQAEIDELQLAVKNLTTSNETLVGRAEKAEEALAGAHLEIRALKVQSEQTDATQVLQEQINALEEERDGLVGTIESLKLAHRAEIKELRSQKSVRASKDATLIEKLQAELAQLKTGATPAPAEQAAITITEAGVKLHGTWAQAPEEILKHHLNQATYTMVRGASDAELARARS